MAKTGVDLHAVDAVLKPVHSARYDRFFFSVQWKEKDEKGKPKVSSIPLENFIDSPTAIFVFGSFKSSGKEGEEALETSFVPNGIHSKRQGIREESVQFHFSVVEGKR